MKPLPFRATQIEALRSLRRAAPHATIALIGAGALALHLPEARETKDIDLVVSLAGQSDEPESAIESFAQLARKLAWTRNPKKEHEWTTSGEERIDVLPVGPRALEKRELVWGGGYVMNLTGMRHALRAELIEEDDLQIAVPSVAAIALLKMVA